MQAESLDRKLMRLAMTGIFHGLTHQARAIFEYQLQYGNDVTKRNAQVGMALMSLISGQTQAAVQIIELLDCESPEELGFKALIYKAANIGHCDEVLAKLDTMGDDAIAFAKDIRNN